MASFIVKSPGLLSTVQDRGRYGLQRFGLPVAGVMDDFSMSLANIIVGNLHDEAVLELTLWGPELVFTDSTYIAITGANMEPELDGKAVPLNSCIKVKNGSLLRFPNLRSGCRSYLAFRGGMDIEPVLGSRSTFMRAGLGGLEGRKLNAGDEIALRPAKGRCPKIQVPKIIIPDYGPVQEIRILRGPEAGHVSESTFQKLCTEEYRITDQSDRMGYRLEGPELQHIKGQGEIISAGIVRGTIQLPGNGQPIILLSDRQTTGGYSRIAVVATADLSLLAQMKPGDSLFFREVGLVEARKALLERELGLRRLLHKV